MTDTSTETPPPEPVKIPDPPPPGASIAELEKFKGEITSIIASDRAKSAQELAELRADLTKVGEELKAAREAREAHEKQTTTATTVVVPPASLAPTQPTETNPQGEGTQHGGDSEEGKKRRSWKDVW